MSLPTPGFSSILAVAAHFSSCGCTPPRCLSRAQTAESWPHTALLPTLRQPLRSCSLDHTGILVKLPRMCLGIVYSPLLRSVGKPPRKVRTWVAVRTTIKFRDEYDTGKKGGRGEKETDSRSKKKSSKIPELCRCKDASLVF